ncbi:MAG: hypothetical protein RLZZ200_517 [Pseudomonadota bacterium]|jgi:hypothetical protein
MPNTSPAAATQPRFIKVSDTGLLLPSTAAEWSGVYIPAIELTVARRILPIRGDFTLANKACAEQDLCGAKAVRSVDAREFFNHLQDFDRYGPCLDPEFFTIDDPWQWIWTSTECAPRGYAVAVYLYVGNVCRLRQSNLCSALPCRPGQITGSLVPEAA